MGKYLRKSETNMNIPIRIAAVLLCLVLFSTYLVGGLFARFVTSGSSQDSARIAKFRITADTANFDETFSVSLTPQSDPKDYILTVENDSETAVRITALLESEGNLPLRFTYTAPGSAEAQVMTPDEGGVSFSDPLAPGESGTYTIHLSWDERENGYIYADGVAALRLRVTAEQID